MIRSLPEYFSEGFGPGSLQVVHRNDSTRWNVSWSCCGFNISC